MTSNPPSPIILPPEITGHATVDPLRMAFSGKTSAHVSRKSEPVAKEKVHSVWQQRLNRAPANEKRMAYFHIPFCKTHCSYCGFFQNTSKANMIDKYVDYLVREIELTADVPWVQEQPFHAVYFGGGTPTDLSPEHIRRLGKVIHKHLPLANDCELTFESRFTGLDDEKIEACLEAGFNRFSLGVQTFNSRIRRKMSRIDPQEVMLERLEKLASHNQAAVVVDLIYGLPWQTLDDYKKDLDILLSSAVHGADLYQLIVQGATRMALSIEKGTMPAAASTALKADMFQLGIETLEAAHWKRLSVSHWTRDNRERNIYNHSVKAGASILPFGSGGGGNIEGYGTMVHRSLEPYFAMIDAGRKPLMGLSQPSSHHPLTKALGEGFDLGWFDLDTIQQRSGVDLAQHAAPVFDAWEANGLITQEAHFIDLTLAGQFWNVTMHQALNQLLSQ